MKELDNLKEAILCITSEYGKYNNSQKGYVWKSLLALEEALNKETDGKEN
jgi:hypothetical protein